MSSLMAGVLWSASSARCTIPGTRDTLPVDHREDRRPRLLRGFAMRRLGPIRRDRSANRPRCAGALGSSRLMGACPRGASFPFRGRWTTLVRWPRRLAMRRLFCRLSRDTIRSRLRARMFRYPIMFLAGAIRRRICVLGFRGRIFLTILTLKSARRWTRLWL